MIVKTKKYKLPENTYIRLCMANLYREQWWVILIALAIGSITFFTKSIWFVVLATIGLLLYGGFWLIQFYGVTKLSDNRLIFERVSYEITSQQIMMQIDTKRGVPILWENIKRTIQNKEGLVLVVTKLHLVHLPYKIFANANDIKFIETILKRKGLLK